MPHAHPRVLVINGAAFGNHSATAVTLSNLFRDWPVDRLALAHTDSAIEGDDTGRRSWRLSSADVPIDGLIRKLLGRPTKGVPGSAPDGMPRGLGLSGGRQARRRRVSLSGVGAAWADLLPLRPTSEFWDWVDAFKPDVVYSMMGSIRLLGLALGVARRAGIPIVPHFMDDWPTTHYRGALNVIPRSVMLSRIRSVVGRAPVGMAIGPSMAHEYEHRYGVRFEAFMNCVDVPSARPPEPAGGKSRPVKFVYVGGLHLDRWRALLDIGRALALVRSEGCDVELDLHAPPSDLAAYAGAFAESTAITLGASLTQAEIPPAMLKADVLVHVESFAPVVRDYTRLSLSTKVPQYMACGRPILAYGPGELASCQYIQDCQCGIVVGEPGVDRLADAVRLLGRSASEREAMGARGWLVAAERHSGPVVRRSFRATLAAAAASPAEAWGRPGSPARAA